MREIVPASGSRQGFQFSEGKGTGDRNAGIVPGHRFAKDESGEQMHADFGKPTAAQIGDENEAARKFGATPQEADRFLLTEMM
jgi:hypothetical protein